MAIIAAAIVVATAPQEAQAKDLHLLRKIHHNVRAVHKFQDRLGVRRTKYHYFAEKHCKYSIGCKEWVLGRWQKRHRHWHRVYRSSAAYICSHAGTDVCISAVFGSYGSQANRVASCESGHSIYAANGQYLGLFQMGSSERATYGYALNAYVQSVSAYHYFVASGRDWSPWTCKP